jgi:hypothetical protein
MQGVASFGMKMRLHLVPEVVLGDRLGELLELPHGHRGQDRIVHLSVRFRHGRTIARPRAVADENCPGKRAIVQVEG